MLPADLPGKVSGSPLDPVPHVLIYIVLHIWALGLGNWVPLGMN